MNVISNCPICNHNSFTKELDVKDHMISGEDFVINSCDSCGFWFTNPIPNEDKIGLYYKSEDYVSHSSTKKGVVNWLYGVVRKRTLKQKVALVDSLAAGKKVVDYGCGTGHFVNELLKNNFDAIGFEPDAEARLFAKNHLGLLNESLEHFDRIESDSLDVVTMWHVLEHVYHLRQDLATVVSKIRPNGFLVVAVPNRNSHDAISYGDKWAAFDVPRHLYHFTPNDIKRLVQQYDLELINILPMKFDAYYVSMLSEKYKGGSLLSAFLNGWKSNSKGEQDKYSSQIYVLRKNS